MATWVPGAGPHRLHMPPNPPDLAFWNPKWKPSGIMRRSTLPPFPGEYCNVTGHPCAWGRTNTKPCQEPTNNSTLESLLHIYFGYVCRAARKSVFSNCCERIFTKGSVPDRTLPRQSRLRPHCRVPSACKYSNPKRIGLRIGCQTQEFNNFVVNLEFGNVNVRQWRTSN